MTQKKQALLEDIMDITARLSWWVGLVLAVTAYLILHHFATQPEPTAATGPAFVDLIGITFSRSLATIGQYILPMVFVFGALSSVLRRRQRRDLFDQANQETGRAAIQAMSWQVFEMLVGEAYRQKGYVIAERGGRGAGRPHVALFTSV